MIDQLEYENSLSQNSSRRAELNPDILVNQDGLIDQIRDDMREKFGWQSPYDYYYGSSSTKSSDLGVESSTILSLDEIEAFGGDTVERADRSVVPHYFWINSLANWCYFKASSFTPSFSKTYSWCPGPLRALLCAVTFGVTEAIETISTEGWKSWWKIPVIIATSELSVVTYFGAQTAAWITGAGDLAEKYNTVSLPFLLYAMITGSYTTKEADVNAEGFIEELLPNPEEVLMPRACMSLYMWNGYNRSWLSVKTIVDTYNRYCKGFSKGYFSIFLDKRYIPDYLDQQNRGDRVDGFIKTLGLTSGNAEEFRRISMEYTPANRVQTIEALRDILFNDPGRENYCKFLSRMLVMKVYGFDPLSFDFLTQRGNISKKQIHGVDSGDSSKWGRWHYIENWGMYSPLPRDSARVKLFSEKSFQLINRPYTYVGNDWRDHNGWSHKCIGHPCFFRGNDDMLWIGYWKRWTSGNLDEKKTRSLFTETTTMDGSYDISTDDLENWDSIIDLMFEKHDDYGFDEWMANCDYGVAYKKFTIDEESPTPVPTFEESTLNPNKAPPVNSIDKVGRNSMILSLSSGTVIDRDDDNGTIDPAKRWR